MHCLISVGFKMIKLNRCRNLSNKKYHRSLRILIMKLVLFLKNNSTLMMIRSTSTINLPVKNNFKIKIKIKVKIKNLISMIPMTMTITMTITLKFKRLIIVRPNKNLILVLMVIFWWLSQAQLRMFWILRAIEHNFGLYLFVIL